MPFLLNRSSVDAVDFATAPMNTLAYDPRLYGGGSPAPFLYPELLTDGLTNSVSYSYLYGGGKGLFRPTFTGISIQTDNLQRPNITDSLNECVIFNYNFTGTNVFAWNITPFGDLALGPVISVPDGQMPVYPGGYFIFDKGDPTNIPFTVDGNGKIYISDNGNCGIGNITDQTWYNAFPLIDGDNAVFKMMTIADTPNLLNTTMIEKQSGLAPAIYATRWRQSPFSIGGPYTYTQDYIQLSDPADDALYQSMVDYSVGHFFIRSNGEEIFFNCITSTDPVVITCFAFSKDLNSYRRIDLTAADFYDGLYFEDIEGRKYFIGLSTVTFDGSYKSFSSLTIQGQVHLGQVFSLGCWSPCANLAFRFIGEDLPNA